MILVLKDGTKFDVLEASTATQIKAELTTIEEVDDITKKLSEENLEKFNFTDDTGETIGTYENYKYVSTEYEMEGDVYKVTYNIVKMSDIEVKVKELAASQKLQDGAIEELAEIVGGE